MSDTTFIHKLKQYKFPIYIIKLIQSYLKERTFQTKYEQQMSTNRVMTSGVPQGSVLGPNTEISIYADDTVINKNSKNEKPLEILNKTEYYKVFSHKNKHYSPTPIKLNNTEIIPKNKVKYLGITLDRKLLFTEDVKTIRNNNRCQD